MTARPRHSSCYAAHCRHPARWAFLAVTGGAQADRIVLPSGKRLRCCQSHLIVTSGALIETLTALPGGGPARLRAVAL